MRIRALTLGFAALCSAGCGQKAPEPAPPPPALYLTDSTAEAGITFEHAQSRNRNVAYLPETLGPGVAGLDYDGDGRPDLFFVQGSGHTNGKDPATVPVAHLYRSAGAGPRLDETGVASGAALKAWGQAVLACDWNNDGFQDLVVTAYREPITLLTNRGDGTFDLARGERGLPPGDRWWSSATALDRDRDGWLDLYLGAYVKFGENDWQDNPPNISFNGVSLPQTMAPTPYQGDANAFVANAANGSWRDMTAALDVANTRGRTLGALAADLDQDGWTDLLVANDVSPIALFHNRKGALPDEADLAMISEQRGSMGLALGDLDHDGALDVICSHWLGDHPAIYRHLEGPKLAYQDVAPRSGIGAMAPDKVGWAVSWRDFDGDGQEDVLIVNGHTSFVFTKGKLEAHVPTLLLGQGSGKLRGYFPEPGSTGPLNTKVVGRGAAFTDVDNDGRVDVAVGVNNGPAALWKGLPHSGHWIGLLPVGTLSNRNGVGALMDVASGTVTRHAQVVSGDSFFSSSDARVLVSLGAECKPARVTVRWPSGRRESFEGLSADRYHRLVEGTGRGS